MTEQERDLRFYVVDAVTNDDARYRVEHVPAESRVDA